MSSVLAWHSLPPWPPPLVPLAGGWVLFSTGASSSSRDCSLSAAYTAGPSPPSGAGSAAGPAGSAAGSAAGPAGSAGSAAGSGSTAGSRDGPLASGAVPAAAALAAAAAAGMRAGGETTAAVGIACCAVDGMLRDAPLAADWLTASIWMPGEGASVAGGLVVSQVQRPLGQGAGAHRQVPRKSKLLRS